MIIIFFKYRIWQQLNIITYINIFVLVLLLLVTSVQAQDINQKHNTSLTTIAVLNLVSKSNNSDLYNLSNNIAKVIRNDLVSTGLFKPFDSEAMLASYYPIDTVPQFEDWRLINVPVLMHGQIKLSSDDNISVSFRLWDVFQELQLQAITYSANRSAWRRIAHTIADAIYSRLTGEGAYFDSSIVYVAESGPRDRRIKRLAIMDQDGANHRFLTDGTNLVLTPRFSPIQRKIVYLSYSSGVPHIYLYEINSGYREILGTFEGITFAPRYSPDGNSLIFSQAIKGNSEIFRFDLLNHQCIRLTNNSAIDTSPSYSPDGKRIVFTSDRGGKTQIYMMHSDGSNPVRISFGNGNYTTPVWSPKGDLIAFTKYLEGQFYIGVMRIDGSQERLLSQSYFEEAPTWSPNGKILMFFREFVGGKTKLYSINLINLYLREIITPGDASDPSWSPLKNNHF